MILFTLLIVLMAWDSRVDAAPSFSAEPRATIVEGDILVYSTSDEYRNSAVNSEYSRWPEGAVYVQFDPSLSTYQQERISDAMREIQEKTCVRFYFADNNHEDFILIYRHPDTVCASQLGRTGGRQILYLAANCLESRKAILHELMHALGFIHEHNRSDRDNYIDINWGNIYEHDRHNYFKRNFDEVTLMGTEYAYDSIMHYQGFEFAINKWYATIIPKQYGVKLGGGNGLSDIDALRIDKYYQCNNYQTHPEATLSPTTAQVSRGEQHCTNKYDCWLLNNDRTGDVSSDRHYYDCEFNPVNVANGNLWCGKWVLYECGNGQKYDQSLKKTQKKAGKSDKNYKKCLKPQNCVMELNSFVNSNNIHNGHFVWWNYGFK